MTALAIVSPWFSIKSFYRIKSRLVLEHLVLTINSADGERNVVRKLTEKAVPVYVLHRSRELEHSPLRYDPPVKKIDDGSLLWIDHYKTPESWTEIHALPIIRPDEQTPDLLSDDTGKGSDDDGDDDEHITLQVNSLVILNVLIAF